MSIWSFLFGWWKPRPPKPPVPPPPALRAIAIIVKNTQAAPVQGASVRLDGHNEVGVTNSDGYYAFLEVPESLVETHLFVTHPEYLDSNKHLTLAPGNGDYYSDPLVPLVVPVPVRTGRTSIQNGAFVDDGGPYNPIGASFFPAVWAHKYDYDRFVENAKFLAAGGIDYVRIWGQVGGDGVWADRSVDPTWPDYDEQLAGTIDVLYSLGLRTQVTILAGAGDAGVETYDKQKEFVKRVVDICNARKEKIQFLELSNESWNLSVEDNRSLGRYMASLTDIPCSLTSVSQSDPSLYADMRDVVELAIVHYDRDISKADGYDRPTRQPWGYPGEYFPDTSVVPQWAIDNEGIGPYSSVAEDKDPLRNITRRVVAWIAAAPASLWHAGPGIYFGGQGAAKSGSPANFWEVPGVNETLDGFELLRKLVPAGIAAWHKTNSHWTDYPWTMVTPVGDGMFEKGYGCVRAYATTNGSTVVCVPFGIADRVELAEKRPLNWTVYSLLDGHVIQSGTGNIRLNESDGVAQLIVATY